jgi:hypothetical protein
MLNSKSLSHFLGRIFLGAFFIFSILTLESFATNRAGSNKMPASSFWSDVFPIGTIDYHGCPDAEYSNRIRFWYHLYREPDGDWFLMGNGNGQLWKLDTNLTWKRLDNTFFGGYDFNSYMIYPGMKYGGYGYWRTNGMLFNYREKVGEWELVPLSKEYPVFGEYCYYDVRRNVLMQTGAIFINDCIKQNNKKIDSLFELDLLNREWKASGRLNPKASFFLDPMAMLEALEIKDGQLLYTRSGDTCAIVDYINKNCIVPNLKARLEMQRLTKKNQQGFMLVSTRNSILLVDTAGFTIVDSLTWSQLLSDPEIVVPMLQEDNVTENNYSNYLFILGGLTFIGGGWLLYRRRQQPKGSTESNFSSGSNIVVNGFFIQEQDEQLLFKGSNLSAILEEQEIRLLRILIENKRAGQTLNTLQFNELLEIDSRSPDNQKKIRSEVVKGVNIGLQRLGFPYEAICRIRLEEDRRMMVYFLHDSISV